MSSVEERLKILEDRVSYLEKQLKKDRRQKNRDNKDPNAPRRPISPYFMYMHENRESLKKEKPELSFTQLSKELSERWKNLPDEQKKVFVDKFLSEKTAFKEKMDSYKASKKTENNQ